MIKWLKQWFCKHDYQPYTKHSKFHHLHGVRVYIICAKCGRENGSYFHEQE